MSLVAIAAGSETGGWFHPRTQLLFMLLSVSTEMVTVIGGLWCLLQNRRLADLAFPPYHVYCGRDWKDSGTLGCAVCGCRCDESAAGRRVYERGSPQT